MMPSKKVGEDVSMEEKIGFLFIHSNWLYSHCEKVCLIFQVDKMNSKWEGQNKYPCEHPVLIPMVYTLPRDLILCDGGKFMKGDGT